jgi:hypothetical protein
MKCSLKAIELLRVTAKRIESRWEIPSDILKLSWKAVGEKMSQYHGYRLGKCSWLGKSGK